MDHTRNWNLRLVVGALIVGKEVTPTQFDVRRLTLVLALALAALSASCVYLGTPPFLREQAARETAFRIAEKRRFNLACEALRRAGVEWDYDLAERLLYRGKKLVGYVELEHAAGLGTTAKIERRASRWAPIDRDARAQGVVYYLAIPADLQPDLAAKVREELEARGIEARVVLYPDTP